MSITLDLEQTVGQLVLANPSLSRVFEKYGIDYCCGGGLPVTEACARKGIDPSVVASAIEAARSELAAAADPARMSLTELCDHIESTHHEWLKTELPRLRDMSARVVDAHGSHYPWVIESDRILTGLIQELTSHMMKEEQYLFPAIRNLEAGRPSGAPFGDMLEMPVSMMEHEHESAGQALDQLQSVSSGYTPPSDACNTFRALLAGLAELQADLHEHIHKENNILFPRSLEKFARH